MAIHVCSGSGSPVGSVTPIKLSQHYTDSSTNRTWISTGLTNTDWVEVGSGVYSGPPVTIVTKIANYTALSTDYTILVDASAGDVTITLPAAASNDEKEYNVKKIDSSSNTVTIDGNASETIDGNLTLSTTVQYTSITVQCDGTEWWII